MKGKIIARTVIILVIVLWAGSLAVQGQGSSITIDQIEANQRIVGYVRGLQPGSCEKYKVIVYVHTDAWYIHPYAGQGVGLSWAPIKPDGSWEIATVQREFKADKIGALVVPRDYPEPSKVISLDRIQAKARVIKKLVGTSDFGSL
jgi:hypothetical protein